MESETDKPVKLEISTFEPAALGVDLSGSALDIEKRLLPDPSSLYVEIQTLNPGVTISPFDIERSILRNWHRDDFCSPGKYGTYWWQHFLRYMKLLMPRTIITPAFVDMAKAMELGMHLKKDLLNLIGCKSSGKSAYEARAAITLVSIDPDYTRTYVAAPFKNVADFTIWSELQNCFEEVKENHSDVFPSMKETPSAKLLQLTVTQAKAGRVDLIGLDNVGKLQGTKSRDPERGWMLLLADEIALFPTKDFVQVLDNVTSNLNFFGIDGCNFKSLLGMDGQLCDPINGEYDDLQPDRDHLWESGYNSLTLRLDGHVQPNVLTKRLIYPFLLTEEKRQNMEDQHTMKGPKYLEQIRSFPHHGAESNFLLTMSQLRSGGAFDTFWSRERGLWTRLAVCDPGWGGDPCKICAFEFGPARLQAHDGSTVVTNIFRPLGSMETIPVQVGVTATEDILTRLSELSNGPVMIKEGMEVTMDMQIALYTAEFLKRLNVPRSNFAFDSSCRGSITHEFATVLGPEVKVYDLVNMATEMVVDAAGSTARARYRNLRTEVYFTLQLIVAAGQFRSADQVMNAVGQACRHQVIQAGMKTALESKVDYKKNNQGKSPDDSDVLAMASHLARRLGFNLVFDRKASTVSTSLPIEIDHIRPRPAFQKLTR